jgi:hypothetical protein
MKLLKASFAADCILCRRSLVHKEGHPLGEERWFESSYRVVSICLLIGDICQITLFTMNTIDWPCLWFLHNARNGDLVHSLRWVKLIPCLQPGVLPAWFTDTSIDKTEVVGQFQISCSDSYSPWTCSACGELI